MIGKLLVIVGGAVFAVFIYFYSVNTKRAEFAAQDLGIHRGASVDVWTSSAEMQLAIAIVGLAVAVGGVVVDRLH